MRRPLHALALLVSSVLSAGCGPLDQDDPAEIDGASEIEEAALAAKAPICDGRRWITSGPPSACVASSGFAAEPLFPQADDLPPQLAGYCVRTWAWQSPPSVDQINSFKSSFSSSDIAEDCALVAPLTANFEESLAKFLRRSIVDRIGVVTGNPTAAPAVHVAVVDTAPDSPAGVPVIGNNRHGDTMAALIGEVVQVPGAVVTSTALAMPYYTKPGQNQPVYTSAGGDFGHLSDLSRALWWAIQHHRADHPDKRLVLNLSLGWEPLTESSSCDGSLLPAAGAVRELLEIAVCDHDALIVAAAGNDMGGPSSSSGLTCPAAWMTQSPKCAASKEPLLLAAYGLDYSDAPIVTARQASATPFGAPAMGGVAWPANATPPAPLTGSSVSAAAVTASIAAVWAAAPTLDRVDVMALLHAHSPSTNMAADVCTPGLPSCDVRRISPCGALLDLGSPWQCQSASGALGTSNPELDQPTLTALQQKFTGALPVLVAPQSGALPSELIPSSGGQNKVYPLPIYPVCPNCFVSLGGSTTAANPAFYGETRVDLSQMTLILEGAASSSRHSISGVTPGTPFRAPLPPFSASIRSAWLSAVETDTGLSVMEQVLVVQ